MDRILFERDADHLAGRCLLVLGRVLCTVGGGGSVKPERTPSFTFGNA